MRHIPDNGHAQSLERHPPLSNRIEIEQRLSRMLMPAVAGIDHRGLHPASQGLCRSRRRMTQHDDIRLHGLNVARRIEQGFAFDDAARRRGKIDDIRAQSLGRQLERRARSRARLEEEIHNCTPAQRRHFLDLAAAHFLERIGRLKNKLDILHRQGCQTEQIFMFETHGILRLRLENDHPVIFACFL